MVMTSSKQTGHRDSILRVCLSLALWAALGSAALAQVTASIQGTITDPSGASVVGAKIVVKSTALGIERTSETDTAGNYEVPALPPGTYDVQVQKPGFASEIAKEVVLEVNQNVVQNFTLKVAESSTLISVESTPLVIDSTTITVGQVIDKNVVQEIPLNGRHFVDLAQLVPGTVTPPVNGFLTVPIRGQGSLAFNSAGGREDAINFMINGVNLSDMLQNQVTFQPTINTVSEFKINNSTYSAEYGRNSGSIVNIATRSGTEEFHGEAYDYLRNNWLDARNFFNPQFIKGVPNPQSVLKRNQFGGDGGGPIIKGKTYFFLSYEGLRHHQGISISQPVFTPAQLTQIQNSNNAVAKSVAALVPAANGTLNGQPAFFGSGIAPVQIDQGTADLTQNFSDSDRLHVYYAYQADLRQEPTAGGTNLPGFGDTREGHRQAFTLGETHVFSPALVNEVHIGVNRIHITFTPNNLTNPSSVGLGTVLGNNETFLPVIRIQDLGLIFGSELLFPQGRGDTTPVFGDTVTYIRGRHSFKFGGEFRNFHNNNFNGDPGRLTFNTTSDFINGVVDASQRTIGNIADRITENALDFFAQDSYKLKPSLTLELGLRYSWNMSPTEARDRFVVFDPATSSLLQVNHGIGDVYHQNAANFQPRVGFAWDPTHNGRTVVRAGYGFMVDQPVTGGFVIGLASNPPFGLPISTSAPQSFLQLTGIYTGSPSSISPQAINRDFKNADVQSWNLNVQRQVTNDIGIMVGYFGSKGTHLEIDRNINQPTVFHSLSSVPFKAVSASSPFLPGVSLAPSLRDFDSSANSIYHALWITANKRFAHGLQFSASYTFSHSIDDNSRNAEGIVLQNSTNVVGDRGSSDFDVRHRFTLNSIYDLPFKGNRLVSGWGLAGIVTAQSGNPFTVVLGTASINGVANSVRPNITGPLVITGDPANWFANAAAVFPLADSTQTGLGNLGRNTFVGPGFTDVDLSAVKNTKLTERLNLQFRVDAFDLLNHPNFGQPGSFNGIGTTLSFVKNPANPAGPLIISPSFGTISSTRFPVADSGSSRQLQLALKLQF